MRLNMNNRFAVINFSPNLNIRRRTIKLRQLKAMFTFTTLRLHLHTIEYRMPLRGEFRLEIFQFPYWLSNPKFRPPALSFGAQKKFRSESLTVYVLSTGGFPVHRINTSLVGPLTFSWHTRLDTFCARSQANIKFVISFVKDNKMR